MNITAGTIVRLKAEAENSIRCPEGREDNATATVRALLDDGGIFTDRDLGGCRYWNLDDVERAS